jgi:hypothetical protein
MSEEKKKVRILDLPCDSKKFSANQATYEDAWDQLSAIQRLIEEGLYPEEKNRIFDDKFKTKFDSELSAKLQLDYYGAIERAGPEIAIVMNFLEQDKSRIKDFYLKYFSSEEIKSQKINLPCELEKAFTEIVELQEWCKKLLLLGNEQGIQQSCNILKKAAAMFADSEFDEAAACLALFNRNSSRLNITYEFTNNLLEAIDAVTEAAVCATQKISEKKSTPYKDFVFKEQVVEPVENLKIFAQELRFSKCVQYVLNEIRTSLEKFTIRGYQEALKKLTELKELSINLNLSDYQQLKQLLYQGRSKFDTNTFSINHYLAHQRITEIEMLINQLHKQNEPEVLEDNKINRITKE